MAQKVAKCGTTWHTGWSDGLETTFNRFLVIKNIGIDTYQGMVVIKLDFGNLLWVPRWLQKWHKAAKVAHRMVR